MDSLFARVALADLHQDVARNIVSPRQSQDLFDDRPVEDAAWFNAIVWPFKHWQQSRFSDGSFGVWYGSESVCRPVGENVAIFNPAVLSSPRHACQLTYRLEGERIVVEKQTGVAWGSLEVAGSWWCLGPASCRSGLWEAALFVWSSHQ